MSEPVDDRAMQPPSDPWATINRPVPTVYLGDSSPDVGQTVRMSAPTPAPPAQPQGEVRFGPGVPATAPAWPGPAPRKRRRRVTPVLSGLLTLAIVAVVGFYIWQQLRPIQVDSATVAVPKPAGNSCDVTVDVVATVHTNGRSGVIKYQWFRTDAAPSTVLSEQVGRGQRTATITLKWTFNGVGTTTEKATLNITSPSPLQASTNVAYHCQRGRS